MRTAAAFCFLLVLMITVDGHVLCAQEITQNDALYSEIVTETMVPYFEALKNGDVSTLQHLISGRMLERNKVLLEQNTEYPEFLRNYYRNVTFEVEKVEYFGSDIRVTVTLEFPGQERASFKYILQKNANVLNSDGSPSGWTIAEILE
jgi:hypothetical protein